MIIRNGMEHFLSTDAESDLNVARGRTPGMSAILKFGENPDIDSASGFETIWDAGGLYVPPTVARLHDVVSTSVLDAGTLVSSGTATGGSLTNLVDTGATFVSDGVAVADVVLNDSNCEIAIVTAVTSETELALGGMIRDPNDGNIGTPIVSGDSYRVVTNASTGASIFFMKGLSASFLEQDEFVILNGTSNVATSGTYARVFRARAFGANATAFAGTVTATAQTDGTISCQVINGNNQTLMAVTTVPFDSVGYIVQWWGSLSKKLSASSVIRLRGGTLDGLGYILQSRAINTSGSSSFDYKYTVPMVAGPGVDVWVEADTDTNNTGVASGFGIKFIKIN